VGGCRGGGYGVRGMIGIRCIRIDGGHNITSRIRFSRRAAVVGTR